MKYILVALSSLVFLAFVVNYTYKPEQLVQPEELAKKLNNEKAKKPTIINVGPEKNIKTALDGGPASIELGITKIKGLMPKIKKETEVVIYCGCCALEHCENIPPAYKLLKDAGYKKVKILNLKNNLKDDWQSKGYPMGAEKN